MLLPFSSFFGETDLDLLIDITLYRYFNISLSCYRNYYKFSTNVTLTTVFNTNDKRKKTEKFQNHELPPRASLRVFPFPVHKSPKKNYLHSQFYLSVLPTNFHVSIRKDMEILHIYLQCFLTKLDLHLL